MDCFANYFTNSGKCWCCGFVSVTFLLFCCLIGNGNDYTFAVQHISRNPVFNSKQFSNFKISFRIDISHDFFHLKTVWIWKRHFPLNRLEPKLSHSPLDSCHAAHVLFVSIMRRGNAGRSRDNGTHAVVEVNTLNIEACNWLVGVYRSSHIASRLVTTNWCVSTWPTFPVRAAAFLIVAPFLRLFHLMPTLLFKCSSPLKTGWF